MRIREEIAECLHKLELRSILGKKSASHTFSHSLNAVHDHMLNLFDFIFMGFMVT